MPKYILFWVPRALEISLLGLSHLHEQTYNRQTGTLQAISEDREALIHYELNLQTPARCANLCVLA